MAVLPATLMTYGNLTSENEITAMRACGYSLYRMILPGLFGAAILVGGLVFYNNYVLPESNHRLMNLLIDIQRKQPTVELSANRFIDDVQGYTFYFREKNDRTGEIDNVQIFRRGGKNELPTTIVAESGRLQMVEGQNVLRVDLSNGEIHELPLAEDRGTYRRTTFKEYTLNIKDVDRSLQRSEREYRGDREMSVRMMNDKIQEIRTEMALSRQEMIRLASTTMEGAFALLDAKERARRFAPAPDSVAAAAATEQASKPRVVVRPSSGGARRPPLAGRGEFLARSRLETELGKRASFERQIRRFQVEIHKKYAIPFACVIFVVVGAPLAIRMGRSGMNTAIGLSLTFFLVYYVGLIGGEKLADRGFVDPFLAMWAPNLIFGAMSAVLLRKAAREQAVADWSWVSVLTSPFRRHATANPR
jgi:lipopolysaccharide export system permease protein